MGRALLLLLLAGCNRALGLDPTHPPDAPPDAVGCSGSRFADTITIALPGGPSVFDPTQSDDPLELYLTWQVTTTEFQISVTTRTDPDQPYGTLAYASFGRSMRDSDPSITQDGLHLLFLSDDYRVYQTDRATRQSPWSAATIVAGIDNWVIMGGFDISLDGLRIYFSDGSNLRTAQRSDPTAAFDTATDLAKGLDIGFPGISPDERELFYNPSSNKQLHHITRNDRSLDFDLSTDETLLQDAGDPDVSPDSRTLLYDVDGELTAMHRTCQ
jgi:hypothetical protein